MAETRHNLLMQSTRSFVIPVYFGLVSSTIFGVLWYGFVYWPTTGLQATSPDAALTLEIVRTVIMGIGLIFIVLSFIVGTITLWATLRRNERDAAKEKREEEEHQWKREDREMKMLNKSPAKAEPTSTSKPKDKLPLK